MSGPATSQTNLPVAAFFLGIIAILILLMFSVWKDGQEITGESALQTADRLQEQRSVAVTASVLPSSDSRLPLSESNSSPNPSPEARASSKPGMSSETQPPSRTGSVSRRIPRRYPRVGTGVFALAPNFEPTGAEVSGE